MTHTPEKTLRDEFAMAALTGMIAKYGLQMRGDYLDDMQASTRVTAAFQLADLAMKERMK